MSFADICIVFADTSKCFHACRYSCTYLQNPLEKNVFFYIIFTINEYLAASEQPTFTVTYAYTLPSSLSVGEIYLFKNAGSGKYMDVQNGTDANDTNVIQCGLERQPCAEQYKLEKSSTGNGYILRSQVGGKTRVLDIYKTNGRVENGDKRADLPQRRPHRAGMADYPCKQRELQNRAALQSGLGIDLLRLLQRQRVGQIAPHRPATCSSAPIRETTQTSGGASNGKTACLSSPVPPCWKTASII